ncbi:uncharacterized protein TNIN_344621 [Trichonephila inaurata madagascariensis]|uniref:EGF-like domain-containing protein n=1 Tax=Trichonephila inaurata madagascariensis TaxID=2747483 RepID=A0A8X6X699_9ARAC|nr:uncharacterized protein TNIN_344621 [Trichonephila inaurata madagascariensis]
MAQIKRNVWLFGFLALGACYFLFGEEVRSSIGSMLLIPKIEVEDDTFQREASIGRKLLYFKYDADDLLEFSSTSESLKGIKYVSDAKAAEGIKTEIPSVSLKENGSKSLRRNKRASRRGKKFSWALSINASKHVDPEIPKKVEAKESFQSKPDEYLDMAVHLKGAGPDKSYEKLHEAWESLGSIMDKLYREDSQELDKKPDTSVLVNTESTSSGLNKSLKASTRKPNGTESLKPLEAIGNMEQIDNPNKSSKATGGKPNGTESLKPLEAIGNKVPIDNRNKSLEVAEKSREPKLIFGLLFGGGNSENPPLEEGSGMVFEDESLKKDNISAKNQSEVSVEGSVPTKIPVTSSSAVSKQGITKRFGVQESFLKEPTVISVGEPVKDEEANFSISAEMEDAISTSNPIDIPPGITSTLVADSPLTSDQLKEFCISLLSKVQKHPKSGGELSPFNESSDSITTEITITTEVKFARPEVSTEVTTKPTNREMGFIASLLHRITGGRFRQISEDVDAKPDSVTNLNISSNEAFSMHGNLSEEELTASNEPNHTEFENLVTEGDEDILTIANCKNFFQRMQRDAVFSKPNLLDILNNPMLLNQDPSEFNITEIREETQIRKVKVTFDPTKIITKDDFSFPTSIIGLKDANLQDIESTEGKTPRESFEEKSLPTRIEDKVFEDARQSKSSYSSDIISPDIKEDSRNGTLDKFDMQDLKVEKKKLTTPISNEFSINKSTTEVVVDDDHSTEVVVDDDHSPLTDKSLESSTDASRFFGGLFNMGSGERGIQDFDSTTQDIFGSNRSFFSFLNFGSGETALDEVLSVDEQETTTLHSTEEAKIVGDALGFESDDQIKEISQSFDKNLTEKFMDQIHEISTFIQSTQKSSNEHVLGQHKIRNESQVTDINELDTLEQKVSTSLEVLGDGNVDDRRFWDVLNLFGSGDGRELSETSRIPETSNIPVFDPNEPLSSDEFDDGDTESNHTQTNIEIPLVFHPTHNETESATLRVDEKSFFNETSRSSKFRPDISSEYSEIKPSSEIESVFENDDILENATLEPFDHLEEDCDENHVELTEPFSLSPSTEVTTTLKDHPRFFFDGSGAGGLFDRGNATINLVQEMESSTSTSEKKFNEGGQSSMFLQNQDGFSSGAFEIDASSESETVLQNDPLGNATLEPFDHFEEDCDEDHVGLTEPFSLRPSTEVTTASKNKQRFFFDGSGAGSLFGSDNATINLVQEPVLSSSPPSRRRGARLDDSPDMPRSVDLNRQTPEGKQPTNFVTSEDSAIGSFDNTRLDSNDRTSHSDENKIEIVRDSASTITPFKEEEFDKFGPNIEFEDDVLGEIFPPTTPKTLTTNSSSVHSKERVTEYTQKFCNSASECKVLLNERCISVKGKGICDCGRSFIRHPKTKKCEAPVVLETSLRLPGEEFHQDLYDKSSDLFLRKRLESIETILIVLSEEIRETLAAIDVAFEKGSLIVHWKLTLASEGNESISEIIQEVDSNIEEAFKDEEMLEKVPLNAENALLLSVSSLNQCEKKELNYCSIGADCIPDADRGFKCRCKKGYLDNSNSPMYPGEICIELCPPNFCGENGFCEQTADGRRHCLCNGWHIGERCEISGIVLISSFAAVNIFIIFVVVFIICCLRRRRRRRRYYGNNQIMFQNPQEFGQTEYASPRLTAAVALDDLGPTKVSKYMQISTPRFMNPDIRITSPSIVGSSLSYDYDSTFDRTPSAEVKVEPPMYDNVPKV